MDDYHSMMEDARREQYEQAYYEHMADLQRQEWLEGELEQQSQATIKEAVEGAYREISEELSLRHAEISFLKASPYFNLMSISCLLTIEKLSRELVALPVLTSILSSNLRHVHRGDYLVDFLDREIKPIDFVYDVFQTTNDAATVEQTTLDAITTAVAQLGVDGFFVRSQGSAGPTKMVNRMDAFRRFRNQLMHGRITATEAQSKFAIGYFDTWVGLIDHTLSKYDLSLARDLTLSRR
jgi:hypothetical protein